MKSSKRAFLFCLVVFFVTTSLFSATDVEVGKTYYVCASPSLSMREGPGKEYKRIASLPAKTPITVLEMSEKKIVNGFYVWWLKVQVNENIGWIYSPYVEDSVQKVQKLLSIEGAYTGDRLVVEKLDNLPQEHIKYVPKDIMLYVQYAGNETHEYVAKIKDEFYAKENPGFITSDGAEFSLWEMISADYKNNKLSYEYYYRNADRRAPTPEDGNVPYIVERVYECLYRITLRPALNPGRVKDKLLNDPKYLAHKEKWCVAY